MEPAFDGTGIPVAHEVLLGLKKAEAGSELVLKKRKMKPKPSRDGSKMQGEVEKSEGRDSTATG